MAYQDDADSHRSTLDEGFDDPVPAPPPPPRSGCWKWVRRIFLFFFVLFLLFAAGVGWLYWKSHQVPEFYQAALAAETPEAVEKRRDDAVKVEQEVKELGEKIQARQEWDYEITQDELNAWLAEELPKHAGRDWPKELQNPRVVIEEDRIQLGALLDTPVFSGVATVALRPRFEAPRTFIFDIETVRIGTLAIPVERITAELPQLEEGSGLERDPQTGQYRLRLRLDDKEAKTFNLEAVEITKGRIRFAGGAVKPPDDRATPAPMAPGETT